MPDRGAGMESYMKTKPIPALIMLTAGLVACVAGIAGHMETVKFTQMLLGVLVGFYVLGCIVKIILDKNFPEMKEEETTDGEEAGTKEKEDDGGEAEKQEEDEQE